MGWQTTGAPRSLFGAATDGVRGARALAPIACSLTLPSAAESPSRLRGCCCCRVTVFFFVLTIALALRMYLRLHLLFLSPSFACIEMIDNQFFLPHKIDSGYTPRPGVL
jgi:hypothetical protein